MKKIKVLFALNILILTLGVFFTECNVSPCDCPKVKPFLLLNAVQLNNIDKTMFTTAEPTKIKAANLLLDIGMLVSLTAAAEQKKHYNPLINSALACDCLSGGEQGFKNKLTNIEFSLLTDYDTDFKKAAAFDSKIKIVQRFGTNFTFSVKDFLENINRQSGFFSQNFALEINHTSAFLSNLEQSTTGIPFALKMTITMADGTLLTAESNEILLTK